MASSQVAVTGSPIFGVSLEELMHRPGENHIPSLLKPMLPYLADHGVSEPLFLQATNTKELQDLRYQLNKGGKVEYEAKPKVELIASLFKLYLRELPEPLLTWPLYNNFLTAGELTDDKKKVAVVGGLLGELPKTNRLVVELILKFLNRLCQQSSPTSPTFLAHIFTHVFLRPKYETIETMIQLPKAISVVQLLIETDPELIFPSRVVPGATSADLLSITSLASKTSSSEKNMRPSNNNLGERTTTTTMGRPTTSPRTAEQQQQPPTLTTSPRTVADSTTTPASSPVGIDNKVAYLKATVKEALQSLRKDLDALEEELLHTSYADRVIEIARTVRATKKVLDGRDTD